MRPGRLYMISACPYMVSLLSDCSRSRQMSQHLWVHLLFWDLDNDILITFVQNAFIERLGQDFDVSQMLVVDFMHEYELGVWKALFIHLVRILHAASSGGLLVGILDERCGPSLPFLHKDMGLLSIDFALYPSSAMQSTCLVTTLPRWKS